MARVVPSARGYETGGLNLRFDGMIDRPVIGGTRMYFFALVAVAATLYFLVAAGRRPRPAAFLAVILWAAYAIYEYYVANGTLCDANCNIRVDLVLFFPLLGWATYLALRKEQRTGAVAVLAVVCLILTAWMAWVFGYVAVAVVAGVGALIVVAYALKSRLTTDRS